MVWRQVTASCYALGLGILYGCIGNVYNEADEVIAQVRSRTLSIEKWRRSALVPNRYVFLRDA